MLSKKLNHTYKVIKIHDIKSWVYFYVVNLVDLYTLFLSDFILKNGHSHSFEDIIAFSVFDKSDFTTKIVLSWADCGKKQQNHSLSLILTQICKIYLLPCWARVAQWVRSLDLTAHTSVSTLWRGFAPNFLYYTRLATTSDKVCQLLADCRWFSLGTSSSSITKSGHHDIAEQLLKVALNTKIQIQL